ncbi:MAG: NPCBM/NEW2 domain-containing protein [Planctomycetia bacterium]|nr:NPCBM/NEW2 domain-containing protein [Planctomycetia bacterium]
MPRLVRQAVLALIAALLAPLGASAATVVPATGARFEAQLAAIASDGQVTFKTADAAQSIPLADLVTWGALVEPGRGVQVLLASGGLVVADSVRTEAESLAIDSALLGRQTIPLELISGIVLQSPLEVQDRDRLAARLLEKRERADRLLLANGDQLAGNLLAITDKAVDFETAGQKLTVELAKVAAIAFDPSLAAADRAGDQRVLVGLSDGSRISATRIAIAGQRVALSLDGRAPWECPADAIVFLQPLVGRARYLSDLSAESYRHLPYLSLSWPYRNDANVTGTQLRALGHPYAKGIGMHSAGRLTYRLDKRYRAFDADIALDDQVGRGGSVVFAVYADDKLAFKSEVIRGGAPPVPVHVDATGARRLSLIVEYADKGDELDRADWLNARVVE